MRTRVLYVHHRPEPGGAANALARLIEHLDRSRFEPHAYGPPGPALEVLAAAGAETHAGPVAGFTHVWAGSYHGARWLLLGREAARLPAHAAALGRVLSGARFGLVHLNDSPLVPAGVVARRAGIPVVVHLRSALANGGHDRPSRALQAGIARVAAATVAINRDVAATFPRLRPAVVHDSVDLDRFGPGDRDAARSALELPPGLPVASYFGHLYPAKGVDVLVEAFAELRAAGVQAMLLLVGSGVRPPAWFRTVRGRAAVLLAVYDDYERRLHELVGARALEDVVRFHPFTGETPPLYRASDLVVVPSQGPEVGLPAIEAAATGVPTVVTGSLDGSGVVVPGVTGVVAAGQSPAALAEAIGELLAEPARRAALGEAARRHAQKAFDARRNARAVEALYERVLG